jgi:DNA-binding response OmpR family regulator
MVNVLIVDDDAINAKTLAKRLEKRCFKVKTVKSAKECLDLIEVNHQWIILLDIVMPDMDGIELLTIIRQRWGQMELPIIMLTANNDVEQVVECLNLQASDYITKPANLDLASARINSQANLQRLYHENMKKNQLETINSMVITFNHEINNPLTIAIGALKRDYSRINEKKVMIALESLNRIADIVKKIERVTKDGDIEQETYVDDRKMIKLK